MKQQFGLLSVRFEKSAITVVDYSILLGWLSNNLIYTFGFIVWVGFQLILIYGGITVYPEFFYFAFFWFLLGIIFIRKINFKNVTFPKIEFTFDTSKINPGNTTVVVDGIILAKPSMILGTTYNYLNDYQISLLINNEKILLNTSRYAFKRSTLQYARKISIFYNIPMISNLEKGDSLFSINMPIIFIWIISFLALFYFKILPHLMVYL